MSYYDVDAILTDAEKIPCEFQIDVPGLGYLDQNPAHTLSAGTRLQLPLWLAEMLALASTQQSAAADNATGGTAGNLPFLTVNLPPPLARDVVQALKADPRAVPLRDLSAHFYALATRMLDLFDEHELAAVLQAAFATRAAEIALHARKVGSTAGSSGGGGGGGGSGGSSSSNSTGGSTGSGSFRTGSSQTASLAGGSHASDATNTTNSSNIGIGWAGQEFLRSLDEWERLLFRQTHDGAKSTREFLDNVKRNY